ncbi:T9SS type B sorting domain-containing protein [Tenacibaculum aquimarinum]|uniref:T9SS type B sorting domain-containing protein n=1 Tax=Tenacibaculum aquimarinum TaxID=2910675 RepID=UPI001F0A6095|nr:T9SS type B sorting domain-containing protein [Tenacibaculum aquimarinum]MCH3883806.1 T9SS type B sorting domain-containing protein [Tenacibaculum aquimarinum]
MKILILFLFFITSIYSQRTYIPDNNFEQALIDKGYDSGPIDNYVLTSNINNLNEIFLMDYNISDLTGIEDFSNIKHLQVRNNNLVEIDISSLIKLRTISCNNNKLESIDISNNRNLEILFCKNNNIKEIITTNNPLLQSIDFSNNKIEELNFSSNNDLQFISVNNNDLEYLNVKNGHNIEITSFNALNNPKLECIAVDNINYSTINWLNVDNTTSFTDNEEACTPIPCNIFVDEIEDINTCQNYILPELINGNYYTLSGGEGEMLQFGDIISSSQTIYIYNTDTINSNCTKESSFTINIDCNVGNFNSFPLFFTPNDDYKNDFWVVKSNKEIKEILIFNRFGKLISKPDLQLGWDGTYKGNKVPSNTYWYKIHFLDNSLKYGSITLLRK